MRAAVGLAWLLAVLGATTPGAARAQGRTPAPKAKGTSVKVRANVPQASITVEGVLVGRSGEPFDVEPGSWMLKVEAPGHWPRTIPVDVRANERKDVVVNLARQGAKPKLGPVAIGSADGFDDPRKKPAFCVAAYAAARGKAAGEAECGDQKTWWDDVFFAGVSPDEGGLPSLFLRAPEKTEYDALRQDLLARKVDEAWRLRAEAMVAAVPDYAPLHALAALGSALVGRCDRTLAYVNEMRMVGRTAKSLDMAQALCHELGGEPLKAQRLLESLTRTMPRLPEIHFHAARVALQGAQDKADTLTQIEREKAAIQQEALANDCIRVFPAYYPCVELLRASRGARGDEAGVIALLGRYLGTTAPTAPMVLEKSLALAKTAPRMADLVFASFLKAMRNDGDLAAAHLYYLAKTGRSPALADAKARLQGRRGKDYKFVAKLGDALAKGGAHEPALAIFEALLAEDGKRDYARWQLVAISRQRKDWPSCARYAAEVPLSFTNKTVASMRRMQAECLMRQQRYKEAAQVYEALSFEANQDWQTFYNWGMALERLGDKAKVAEVFGRALEMGPSPKAEQAMRKILNAGAGGAGSGDE